MLHTRVLLRDLPSNGRIHRRHLGNSASLIEIFVLVGRCIDAERPSSKLPGYELETTLLNSKIVRAQDSMTVMVRMMEIPMGNAGDIDSDGCRGHLCKAVEIK